MKITLLRALAFGASVAAAPAMAQDTDSFTVNSVVFPYCSQLSISSAPLSLGTLTGGTGQLVASFNGTETSRELAASFYCNAPAKVTVKAEPLLNQAVSTVSDSASFTNRVDYTASLMWNTVGGSVSSTATDAQEFNATQANTGTINIAVTNPVVSNNRRPVAGTYAGQVRLTISLVQ